MSARRRPIVLAGDAKQSTVRLMLSFAIGRLSLEAWIASLRSQ
jgi:hypothetical protein